MVHAKSGKLQCMPNAHSQRPPPLFKDSNWFSSTGTSGSSSSSAEVGVMRNATPATVISNLNCRPQSRPSSAVGGAKIGRSTAKVGTVAEETSHPLTGQNLIEEVDATLDEGFFKRFASS